MSKGLVSILTPCYNAGGYIHRLLDSILFQTYPNVEIIIVDDGSTDSSADIIKSYEPKFLDRGYNFVYKYQENGGQSSAINNGLKDVRGEFLMWPDSDDWYRTSDAIEVFVNKFRTLSNDYAIVRCVPTYMDSITFAERAISGFDSSENQFENCLYNRYFFWGAGNYMVRMTCFDAVNSTRNIYVEKNAGQNWQMLLPVLQKYKCYTLTTSYFNILERVDSHSRGGYGGSWEKEVLRLDAYEKTLVAVLYGIEMNENSRKKYLDNIKCNYCHKRLELAINYQEPNLAYKYIKLYKSLGGRVTISRQLLVLLMRMPNLYQIILKILKR